MKLGQSRIEGIVEIGAEQHVIQSRALPQSDSLADALSTTTIIAANESL